MSGVYVLGAAKFLDGTIDWDDDDIRVALIDTDDYTVDLLTDEFLADISSDAIVDTSSEIPGRSRSGVQALAGDVTIGAVSGDEFEALVVYQHTGDSSTSSLIAYIDGLEITPDGTDVVISWPDGVVFEIGEAVEEPTLNESAKVIGLGLVEGTSTGTVVTAGNGSKGSWTEIEDSLSDDTVGFYLYAACNTGHNVLLDIGVGAEGEEAAIISDLLVTGRGTSWHQHVFHVPLRIAAGSRIVARSQSNATPTTWLIMNAYTHSDGPVYDGVDVLGGSGLIGTQITSGASNTKSAWTEIEDATPKAYRALAVGLSNNADFSGSGNSFDIDLGVGGSGSEVVRIGDMHTGGSTQDDFALPNWFGPFVCGVPAGSRIAVRGQFSTSSEQIAGCVYGFWMTEDQA